jgi:hypothetical protein
LTELKWVSDFNIHRRKMANVKNMTNFMIRL